MSRILEVTALTRSFGGLTAVSNVDLTLEQGELVGLIGPNGAGKTTVFNLLTGVYPPSSGTIVFTSHGKTQSIGGKAPYAICRAGVGRTFQNIRLFKELTVLENVMIAFQQNQRYPLPTTFLRLPGFRKAEGEIAAAVLEQTEIELDKKIISIDEPIKTTGTHYVMAKLHQEVQFPITVEVEPTA